MTINDEIDELRADLDFWEDTQAALRKTLRRLPRDTLWADYIAGRVDDAGNQIGRILRRLEPLESEVAFREAAEDRSHGRFVTAGL